MHKQIDKGEIIYYQYLSDKQKINRIDSQADGQKGDSLQGISSHNYEG